MPVAINVPQRREESDPLEKLAMALQIAKTGFGIAADMKTIESAKQEKAQKDKLTGLQIQSLENEQKGVLSGEKRAGILKDLVPAKEGDKNAFMMQSIGPQGTPITEWVRKAPAEAKQVDPMVGEMRRQRLDDMKRKSEEAESAKDTIYGKARTPDDAKKLKEASELKAKLDREIDELIAIREAKGAELWDRDTVARAKQLSKSLLLTKKNLETLGVLSQSDLDIVNEIIPSDPTQFDWGQLKGNDPTLTKLKAFKSDTQSDFDSRLANRLANPANNVAGVPPVTSGGAQVPPKDIQAAAQAELARRRSQVRK
jgi:hypothetical protein